METIDIYNNKSTQSHFVTLVDIQNMDPCIFPNRVNPITNTPCKETFTNLKSEQQNYTCFKVPRDPISQLYFASLGAFGVYMLYRIMLKNGMVPSI